MHPLSWHVFGGHFDIVALLIENDASINADFDSYEGEKLTVLDIAEKLVFGGRERSSTEELDQNDSFVKVYKLILQKGGKKYKDLSRDQEL